MYAVKVSPKFQVVIPEAVRKALDIHSGEMIHMLPYDNRIELIPVRKMRTMRGFLKGIDTTISRNRDRI